MQRDVIWNYS